MVAFSFIAVNAQDPVFTVIGSNNSIYNPAFSGLNSNFNATIAYRQIYPNITSFSNYGININGLIAKPQIGIGVTALKFYEGNGSFITNMISLNFNKIFKINNNLKFSLGVNAGYLNKNLDVSNKIFSNQLDPVLGYTDGIVSTNVNSERIDKINFASGIAAIYKKKKNVYIAGFSVDHLNSPNISYFEGDSYYYPLFYSLSFYSKINISNFSHLEVFLNPKALITYQGQSSNVLLGTDISFGKLMTGTHIRVKNYELTGNISYIGFNFGINLLDDNLSVIYSYETPISGYSHSGGLHEMSLNFRVFKGNKPNSCI